jgi:hypothetical protein
MALQFNPFENDRAGAVPQSSTKPFSKLRVFDEPSGQSCTAQSRLKNRVIGSKNQGKAENQAGADPDLTALNSDISTRGQPGDGSTSTRGQPGDGSTSTRGQKKTSEFSPYRQQIFCLPRSSSLLTILEFLYSTMSATSTTTAYLSIGEIAFKTGLTRDNVKKSVFRLKRKMMLSTATRSFSCKEGGASYRLSKDVLKAFSIQEKSMRKTPDQGTEALPDQGTEALPDQGTEAYVSSSCLNNNNKQTVGMRPEQSSLDPNRTQLQELEKLQVRLDLDALKLGINDLLPIARNWDDPAGSFTESLEHAVFYLRSAEASSIRSPKAWLLKQLRTGYYGAPADFVSWQDQQLEAKMRSRVAQAERRRQVRMQNLQADFELWLEALDTAARQAIFAASDVPDLAFVSPPMKLHMLRTHFAELHAVPEFAVDAATR